MNETVHKLSAGDSFMPEMHLRQPGFMYWACGPFTKNKERMQKFKETGDLWYIYQNELDKTCFQHDMVYGDFKDLPSRTASDKVLPDKALCIAKNPKYDGYQKGLASLVYTFLVRNLLVLILLSRVHGQRARLREVNLQMVLLKVKLCQTKN